MVEAIRVKRHRDEVVARYLATPAGKRRFRQAFQLGAAMAADEFPPGSVAERLCRMLAGLPV